MSESLEPTEHLVQLDAIRMAYVEWRPHLKGTGPTLLCVHATGFHSRLWDEIAEHLSEFHLIAVDQRGHGRSSGEPVEHWRVFGQDLSQFIERLDLYNLVGVGHSMGAHAMIDAAAHMADRFRRLILIDPTVASPESYAGGGKLPFSKDEPHPASKRKNDFASPEEMIDRFRDRSPYSLFTKKTLRNYCVHGLAKTADGSGYHLACAPEMEASVYMTSRTNGEVFDSVHALDIPVLILRARSPEDRDPLDFTASPTWPGLVNEFREGREIYMPDRTHFIGMEIPGDVAAIIKSEATIS